MRFTLRFARGQMPGADQRTPKTAFLSREIVRKMPAMRAAFYVEAPTGFEPVVRVLQTLALPLGYGADHRNAQTIEPGEVGVKARRA